MMPMEPVEGSGNDSSFPPVTAKVAKMKILKTCISWVRPSILGIKMTAYFVAFGLIIGYLSFLLISATSSRNNLEYVTKTLIPLLQNLTDTNRGDLVDTILNREHAGFTKLYRYMEQPKGMQYGDVQSTFYFFRIRDLTWKTLYLDRNNVFREKDVDAETARSLYITLRRRLLSSTHFFFGRSDVATFYVLLPMDESQYRYVIRISINRHGLATYIRRDVRQVVFFGLVLLAISLVLGKIFSYHLVKPIQLISKTASKRATGDRSVAFDLGRRDEIGSLAWSLDIMTMKIDEHVLEIERRMKTMDTMNLIDKAVLSSISRGGLLDRVIGIVSDMFNSNSIALALYDRGRNGFDIISMYHDSSQRMLGEKPFIPLADLDPRHAENIENIFQFDIDEKNNRAPELYAHAAGKIINAPICLMNTYLGSIVLGKGDNQDFSPEIIESISMLADQVGVALQSVQAFEEREALFLGILIALTRSIDAKSKWTAGHSERVAKYAEEIGLRLNLGEENVRTLTFSAILHDIGKIAISETILDKPGKLTEEEYSLIKIHPMEGARIISDIPSYNKIVPGILYHHEHWDGSGYPEGLRGDDIPLHSRIITVADVYDAITADRPYRSGMSGDDAIRFLSENCGVLFDCNIVTIFLTILQEKRFCESACKDPENRINEG